jgi:predicted dehydrogenase
LKVGVIGAGRIGRVHLETLAGVPGVQPVILSDVVEPVLKEVTAQYGVPNYTLDGDEVKGRRRIVADEWGRRTWRGR